MFKAKSFRKDTQNMILTSHKVLEVTTHSDLRKTFLETLNYASSTYHTLRNHVNEYRIHSHMQAARY